MFMEESYTILSPEQTMADSHGIVVRNLLENLPTNLADEVIEKLVDHSNVRIERIVSHGQSSPDGIWYDQSQDEFVVLLSGSAKLQFDDEAQIVPLRPGDYLNIPAHRKHRVHWTSQSEPTIWLAIHHVDGSN